MGSRDDQLMCLFLTCYDFFAVVASIAFIMGLKPLLNFQVTVLIDASEAEDFTEVYTKPLRSLPYDTPGQTFVAFEKPEGVPAVGKFSNVLKFIVKEVNKNAFKLSC